MEGMHWVARAALACGVLGLCGLIFLDAWIGVREVAVGEIAEGMVGGKVAVRGRVESAFSKDNFVLFTVNDGTGEIKGVIFNPGAGERGLLRENSFVRVQGKVQVYRGELEIVAESVGQW